MGIELRNPFQRVIGTIGYAGVGKDKVAELLGIPAVAFSDALKWRCDTLAKSFGLDLDKREDKEKFREVLVAVGRVGRNIDPNYWLDRIVLPDVPTVAITGVRYLNECKAIQAVGGTLLEVVRPGVGPANQEEANSIGSIRFAAYSDDIDVIAIVNDGTLADLEFNARKALDYPKTEPTHGEGFTEGPVTAEDEADGYCPVCGVHGCDLESKRRTPAPTPYVAQGTPQDFEFGEPDYDATDAAWDAKLAQDDAPEYRSAPRPSESTAKWVTGHPLFQDNLVIDGDDAIPFLKGLTQEEWGSVVIYRGSVPDNFDFDSGANVVLLPAREPQVYDLTPAEPWDIRPLDLSSFAPFVEQTRRLRELERRAELRFERQCRALGCDTEGNDLPEAGTCVEVDLTPAEQAGKSFFRRLFDYMRVFAVRR